MTERFTDEDGWVRLVLRVEVPPNLVADPDIDLAEVLRTLAGDAVDRALQRAGQNERS
jgi:hypothetical protein